MYIICRGSGNLGVEFSNSIVESMQFGRGKQTVTLSYIRRDMSKLHINFNTAENSSNALQRMYPLLLQEMETVIADTKHCAHQHQPGLPDTYRIDHTDNNDILQRKTNRMMRADQLKFDQKWEQWSTPLVCMSYILPDVCELTMKYNELLQHISDDATIALYWK